MLLRKKVAFLVRKMSILGEKCGIFRTKHQILGSKMVFSRRNCHFGEKYGILEEEMSDFSGEKWCFGGGNAIFWEEKWYFREKMSFW